MPGVAASPEKSVGLDDPCNALVPSALDVPPLASKKTTLYKLPHGLTSLGRISISWGNGNQLRVSYLGQKEKSSPPEQQNADDQGGGKVVQFELGGEQDGEKRRIAYGSLPAFALLQNQRQILLNSPQSNGILPEDWWEHVLEYSRSIGNVLAPLDVSSAGKSAKEEKPTMLKAVWSLLELFYVDKSAMSWLPERLVDWLLAYDRVLSWSVEPTIHSRLVTLQGKLSSIQFPEEDPDYWEGMASALAIGWLDIVVNFLRMHGSYRLDQLDDRRTENGLVEAVNVLILKMPRLRPTSSTDALGTAYNFKPEFAKAWEKWQTQVARLENSTFWADCSHQKTIVGLKKMLQILLGNLNVLVNVTHHWLELLVAHVLYVIPFSMVAEAVIGIANKCRQLKSGSEGSLQELMLAIIGNDTEVVLAECLRTFDPWMLAHIGELLTVKSPNEETLLREERSVLGGLSLEELHRLVYAQVLSSHSLTWQLAPVYLASCPKQGLRMLENVLVRQEVSKNHRVALKVLEICNLYDLGAVGTAISRVVGIYKWKHGKRGAGIMWFQRAHDEHRLSAVADQLLASVTSTSTHVDNLQSLEGLLDLLGSGDTLSGGLTFLQRYREFKSSLQSIHEAREKESHLQSVTSLGRAAVKCLLQLLHMGTTPLRFWIPLLQDAVGLLEWPERVLITEHETNFLLSCLQELFLANARGDTEALSILEKSDSRISLEKIRLALAWNLGRAMLDT